MLSMLGRKKRHAKGRIFIVSEFVDPTQNSTGYYWSKIIEDFSGRAGGVSVICPASSHKMVDHNVVDVEYIHFDIGSFNKNKLSSRVLGQAQLSLRFSRAVIANVGAGDRVFSGTNPSLLLFFLSLLKPLLGFRWTLLVHDVFPENLVAAGIVKRKGPLYHGVKALFDKAYAKADTLIAIGRDMQATIRSKTRNQCPVVYIPNWADADDVTVTRRDAGGLLSGHALEGKTVFQLFGNLGRLQGVDNLLAAVAQVQSEHAAFAFIGDGAATGLIHDFMQRHPQRHVVHIGQLPLSSNNIGLSACDVAIVCLASGMNGLGVPSKAYFSMAADKPLLVVTDEGSELHMLMSEEPSLGWFCPSGRPDLLARLIDQICALDLSRHAGLPRSVMLAKYDRARAMERYFQVLQGAAPDES